jgi:hypothetical protein
MADYENDAHTPHPIKPGVLVLPRRSTIASSAPSFLQDISGVTEKHIVIPQVFLSNQSHALGSSRSVKPAVVF